LKLGTKAAADADILRVGTQMACALSDLQLDRPVILAVDDAHWSDQASLQTLGFALRRLRGHRVLTVVSTRDTVAERLPENLHRLMVGASGIRLRLRGMDVAEVQALATQLGTGPLSSRAAARMHEHTLGNPLHLRTLLEELSTETLSDGSLPLPVPRSFAMLVLGRLAGCSPEAERLVVAVAVLGGRCPIDQAARLAEVTAPLAALEQAIGAFLLEERFTSTERLVAFSHPLIKAAVYRDLGPARRSSLHARAAQLIGPSPAALHHRIEAAAGTDPALAAEVAKSAYRRAEAGDWSTAADAFVAAARLSSSQLEKERFLLEAVDWLLVGGGTAEASALEDDLLALAAGPRQRYVLGRLALVTGALTRAKVLLADAWRRCDRRADPALAACIAGQLASLRHVDGHAARAVAWARRARTAEPATADAQHGTDLLLLAMGSDGRLDDLSSGRLLSPQPDELKDGPVDGRVGRSVLRLWSGDAAGARAELEATVKAYQRHGGAPVHLLLVALAALAEAEYRLGAWDAAASHAELALTTAHAARQQWLLARLHAVSVFVPAGRGQWSQAEAHVRTAAASAASVGDIASAAYARTARGLLAAARNDPEEVVEAVGPLDRLGQGDWIRSPGILPWRELYVQALIDLGRHEEADAVLRPLETANGAGSQAAAWRLRGTLQAARGDLTGAEHSFRAGFGRAHTRDRPFGHALLELAYGALLRRRGQRAAAARHLGAAHERLLRLDARPYLERCVRELDACGVGQPGGRPDGQRLTPQERAVARLVVAGCSNREAASQLVLSVKTVEFHLSNIFSKLGVRSRSQLILELPRTGELS
jgi:DNA-binding CsgD family transcriptional regulator